ncbi:MAG TPA: hypothetical protein VGK02_08895 [Candidatus Aquicultor sp.]
MAASWNKHYKNLVRSFNAKLNESDFEGAGELFELISFFEQSNSVRASDTPFQPYTFRLDSKKGYRGHDLVN